MLSTIQYKRYTYTYRYTYIELTVLNATGFLLNTIDNSTIATLSGLVNISFILDMRSESVLFITRHSTDWWLCPLFPSYILAIPSF